MNQINTTAINSDTLKCVRLLLVEDDLVDCKACIRALTSLVESLYDITAVETGQDGLVLLKQEKFDCILLDMHLPDMQGMEFIEQLQQSGNMTPTIVLTGVNDLATAIDAMKRGVRDYLVKDGERRYLELLNAAISRVSREQALVNARKKAEEEQFRAQTQFRVLVEQTPAITYVVNIGEQRAFTYVSPQIEAFGFDRESWINNPNQFLRQLHPEDRARVKRFVLTPDYTGKMRSIEYRLYNAAGHIHWIRDKFRHVADADGNPSFVQGLLIDITDDMHVRAELEAHRRRLEELVVERTAELEETNQQLQAEIYEREEIEKALHEEKEFAQVTLSSIGDAVLTVDSDARVIFVNPVAESLLAKSWVMSVGQPLQRICMAISESNEKSIEDLIKNVMRGRSENLVKHHAILSRRDKQDIPISLSAGAIHSRNGNVVGAVLVIRDVTQERQLNERLNYLATHDELTRLVNRREFEHRLARAIEAAQKFKVEHAVCFIDLDSFKAVNDIGGHSAGDELLRQLSQQITMRMRQRDTIARIGGDEFAVLFEHCPLKNALKRAEELKDIINAFRMRWKGKIHSVGASIGIIMVDGSHQDVTSVLKAADKACYVAKEAGRNCVKLFDAKCVDNSANNETSGRGVKISDALVNDRLILFCQPFSCLNEINGKNLNCEILLRMLDEQGNPVPPSAFLPDAERKSLMPQLDRWVIHHLLQQMAEYREKSEGFQETVFWVNLSGASLRDPGFAAFIKAQLLEVGISSAQLGFEISEATAMADFAATVTAMDSLRDIGVWLALDNVQGAFTTIDSLQTLPLDFLKIDGSLMQRLAKDPVAQVFVEAINRIAQDVMVVQTVAACVETSALIEKVRGMGLNHAQGFALTVPAELETYLDRRCSPLH